jgi:flagellar FliL protein
MNSRIGRRHRLQAGRAPRRAATAELSGMADKQPTETEEDGSAEEAQQGADQEPAKKRRFALPRKKYLLIALPVLVLLGGGGYFAATEFDLPSIKGAAKQEPHQQVYYDLPEMVVNLSSADKRVQYLKLKVALEASDKQALEALTPVMPRVLDTFQLYLRELRATDLEGSAGIFRLKEELLRRINLEISPNRVDRVLFKEIIVQ